MSEREYAPLFRRPTDDPFIRVGMQAALRAKGNGVDQVKAAAHAMALLHEGMQHEEAVKLAAGEFRRTK